MNKKNKSNLELRANKKKDRLYSLGTIETQLYGEKGTPERDAFEKEKQEELEKEKKKCQN